MQEIIGTPGELLTVASGNTEAHSFLLGYVAGHLEPDVIRKAIGAWIAHQEQDAAYRFVHKTAREQLRR